MAATDNIYHNPDYVTGTPDGYLRASEIIAARWDRSGQGLVNQWINSPGHNAIMSLPDMTTVGIGVAYTDGVAGVTPNRYSMYGTANLFGYNGTPAGTYASPADYFAGKPPLQNSSASVTPTAPTFGLSTYTIPAVTGVRYTVNGVDRQAGTYNVTETIYNVKAFPLPGYYFPSSVGATQWGITYTPPATKTATVPDPTFNAGSSTFELHSVAGVEYTVNGQVYPAGAYFSVQLVNIQVRATEGYVLDPSRPTSWSHDFSIASATPPPVPAPAPKVVTPAGPAFNAVAGTYTIPTFEGVDYKVNNLVVRAGVYTGTGTITVTASIKAGYVLAAGAKTSWSGNITKPILNVTTVAPTANTNVGTYTIPAVNGVVYKANNVQKNAGTYTASGTVIVTAEPATGYTLSGTLKWTFTLPNNPAVKPGDMLAADAAGVLWNYGNNSSKTRKSVFPSGYATAKKVFATDWNSDGVTDILTQWKSGSLTLAYGSKAGTFSAAKIIGNGWGSYEIAIGKYNKADKYPSIIAKDTAGSLWHYPNLAGTGTNARVLKGSGWKALQVNLIDWDKDGNMDILAKDSAGKLLLYRTDGAGKFKAETRKVIGTGWASLQIQSIRDYAGVGSQGVLAKDAKGGLYYYGTGKGTWVPRIYKGSGWIPMRIAG
jgi:D-alanyl-D-alanine carboxypeptidase